MDAAEPPVIYALLKVWLQYPFNQVHRWGLITLVSSVYHYCLRSSRHLPDASCFHSMVTVLVLTLLRCPKSLVLLAVYLPEKNERLKPSCCHVDVGTL